jgi:hypothetical protein
MMRILERTSVAIAGLFCLATAAAQVNSKGTFQIGLGPSFGGHATAYEWTARIGALQFGDKSTDAAATVSWPLELQGGLSNRFSLGVILEPGRYIDSAGTHPNAFFTVSLSPRLYLVNRDRFGLFLNMDLGAGVLRIGEVISGTKKYDDVYAGGHFRLGTQAQYYFGRTFGVHLGLKYAAHNLRWRDRDPEDPLLSGGDYEATLRTSGVLVQLGVQAKF